MTSLIIFVTIGMLDTIQNIYLSKFCDILVAISDSYEHFKSQPCFHAEPYWAYFETTVAPTGASRKVADNIICVPKGPLDTSR